LIRDQVGQCDPLRQRLRPLVILKAPPIQPR
jgi:hypothetical protein